MAPSELKVVERALPKSQDTTVIALRKAADETLELRRATASFRRRCLRWREAGALYNVVESWYVQKFAPNCDLESYPRHLVERNPYARFKERNPGLDAALYSKLDFLLDDIPKRSGDTTYLEFGEKEDDPVVMELVVALTEGKLDSLIQPSPYLRHDENVAIASLDARLWLNHSPLPVVLGEKLSYADLRARDDHEELVRDNKPSPFYVSLREAAVSKYYSKTKTPHMVIHHPRPEDFPEGDSYWARLSRVRYPHHEISSSMPTRMFAANLSRNCVAGEEDVNELLEDFKTNETNSTYRVLARLILDKMVE